MKLKQDRTRHIDLHNKSIVLHDEKTRVSLKQAAVAQERIALTSCSMILYCPLMVVCNVIAEKSVSHS